MRIVVCIGDIQIVCDDDIPGLEHTPEQIEEVAHRLGRQAVEVLNMLPEAEPVTEDGE